MKKLNKIASEIEDKIWRAGINSNVTPVQAWSSDQNSSYEILKKFQSKTNSKLSEESNSLNALLPVLWMAKVVGVVPLGISKKRIRFSLKSLSILVWGILVVSHAAFSVLRIGTVFFTNELTSSWIHIFQECIFFVLALSGLIFLLFVTKYLPQLADRYSYVENQLGEEFLPKIKTKVFVVAVILMSSAVGETIASMFYRIQRSNTTEYWRFLEDYMWKRNRSILEALGYTKFIGLSILFINKHGTFVWNYLDLINASIAMSLTAILKGFNLKVKEACTMANNGEEINWTHLRCLHMNIFFLNYNADNIFGYLICQSYLTNLFFILLQVYNGIRKVINPNVEEVDSSTIDIIYLIWSFLHLLGRLALTSMCCTYLYEAAGESLPSLLAVENTRHKADVRRIIHQVEKLTFGLSGVGYFLVNKTFIVTVVGAILTYEIILLEIGQPKT